jgi:NAD(P)H-dependent FMN reductase
MPDPKILAFSGSTRKASINTKLLHVAVQGAKEAGAQVTLIDLADYPMPIYNGDLEEQSGMPERAQAFKNLMIQHQGFLIACPEYNSSFTPLLKNAIDWASRPAKGETPLIAFAGKVAGLVSASAGAMGGYRGLQQVRYVLGNIRCIVLPDMFALSGADTAFDAQGNLTDPKKRDSAMNVGRDVANKVRRLAAT